MSITLRREKGEPLSFDEADINFSSFYYSSSIATDGQGNRFLRLFYTGSEGLDLNQYLPGRESQIPLGVLSSDLDYTTPSGSNDTIQINNNGVFQGYSDFVRTETGVGVNTSLPNSELDVVGRITLNNGGDSVYLGELAGPLDSQNNTRNTGLGYKALFENTTGYQNTAVGFQAGSFSETSTNQNSTNSVFIGYQAKPQEDSQNNEIVIGSLATGNGANTVTIGNTQIKETILRGRISINNGQGSTYLGEDAGGSDTNTNSNNVGIGFQALAINTSGVFNTATGYQALSRKTQGDRNTSYGFEAGKLTSDAQDTTTSNNSVFLGANTKPLADNESNQIVIGYNTEGSGSNTVVLGNNDILKTYLKGDVEISQNLNLKQDIQINGGIYASGSLGVSGSVLTSTGDGITWVNGGAEFERISNKGEPNGYAPLGSSAKIEERYLPDSILGQVIYEGTWSPATNTPTLEDPPAPETKGHYYVCNDSGTQFGITFATGDWIISKGDRWEKVDNTDAVTAVFGRLGNIQALEGDYNSYYPTLTGNNDLTGNNYFSGKIGVGVANTTNKLEVDGVSMFGGDSIPIKIKGTGTGIANNSFISFYENDGSTRQAYIGFGSTGNTDLTIQNTNNSKNLRLRESGELEYNGSQALVSGSLGVNVTPNSTVGRIDASNDIVAFSSDIRLKHNTKVIDKPLEKIKSLKGFTYSWNDLAQQVAGFDTELKMVGVSAQDVQKVLPEAVKLAPFDNDGNDKSKSGEDYLTVQYDKIVPLLLEGIKQQQRQIDNLQSQINKLINQD